MGDDYSFLQEKIKDETESPKRLRKKIVHMILFGFIFGLVACCTFFAFRPLGERLLGKDTQKVSIPEDEAVENDEPEEQEVSAPRESEEQVQKKMLKDLQSTAKDVKSGVVMISGIKTLEEDAKIKKTSGVILADNGSELLILCRTLWNKEPKETTVTFADGKSYDAVWKMCDYNLGIGFCAVSKEQIAKETWAQIEIAELGNSFKIESGDAGVLIGISSAGELKVSYGFIAANEEKIEIADGAVELLRVDAAGAVFEDGLLFNQQGEVIGVVTEAINGNFTHVITYSVSDIKKEMEYLSNGQGVPYIGIWGVEFPDELKKEGFDKGVVIHEIDADSPAMKAGVQCGDVITKLSDLEVTDMKAYREALLNETVKSEVILTGYRKGADDNYVEMNFKVVVGKK